LLYSHHHTDHIGSSNLVKLMFPNVQIHAATEVCNWLKKTKDSSRPVPQHCYTGNFSLSDYGVTAHAIGDATLLVIVLFMLLSLKFSCTSISCSLAGPCSAI
jgi:glyoxylase-like metal-dependent hydrolase (beta-lactamase superfamily II)